MALGFMPNVFRTLCHLTFDPTKISFSASNLLTAAAAGISLSWLMDVYCRSGGCSPETYRAGPEMILPSYWPGCIYLIARMLDVQNGTKIVHRI